jgi:hypothetical protein
MKSDYTSRNETAVKKIMPEKENWAAVLLPLPSPE